MRKLLLSLIIILTIAIIGLPFLSGWHAQNLISQLNGLRFPLEEGELGTIKILVSDQNRGWLNSSATIHIAYEPISAQSFDPHPSQNENAVNVLTSQVQISHGPILWRPGKTTARLAPMLGQAWIEAPIQYDVNNLPERFVEVTGLETGKAFAWISLLGDQEIFVDSHEIAFRDQQGQLNFSGFHMALERSSLKHELALIFKIPRFNFVLYDQDTEQKGLRWSMDNITLEFGGLIEQPSDLWFGTWLGALGLNIDNIQIDLNQHQFNLSQLTSVALQQTGATNSLIDGSGELNIEGLQMDQQSIGPVEFVFNYSNIDKNALSYLRGTYNEWLYSDSQKTFMDSLSEEQQKMFYQELLTFVNHLPAYQIELLEIVTPKGNFDADFSINITAAAANIDELKNMDYWQHHINASLDMMASKDLTKTALVWAVEKFYHLLGIELSPIFDASKIDYNAQADNLLTQGLTLNLLQAQDNNYQSKIQYQEGLLTINDKVFYDGTKK